MSMIDLGLPSGITACLFDLDGVLTDTAAVHAKAWAEMFDAYLQERARLTGEPFRPFDPASDYLSYVDGKPRADGVRDFLASRGIELPEGDDGDGDDRDSGDAPQEPTVKALGDRKNAIVQRRIEQDGVRVYDGSRRYLEAAEQAGLRRAVVSSSADTEQVLRVTGLAPLVELRVDGVTIKQEGLRGKPAPDTFLAGARRLGVTPEQAAVFEDALAGVQAGRAGAFGCVIGVNRVGPEHAAALAAHGADRVVSDLGELLSPAESASGGAA